MANYALANDFYVGSISAPSYHYSNRSIALNSPSGVFTVDIIGNELSIDTFSFTVRYNPNAAHLIYAPVGKRGYKTTDNKVYSLSTSGLTPAKDYLKDILYGTPVFWYVGGSFFAKGYIKSIDRIAKYAWKITCISGVGLLDSKPHAGGVYEGTPFLEIAQSIIGDSFAFTCNADVANTLIYGWLPYADSARDNLHALLFAVGASLARGDVDNDYVIHFLQGATKTVPTSRVSINGSITTQLPSNAIEVVEHSYSQLSSDEETVIFDNTSGQAAASDTIVVFAEPMYGLTVTGTLTISNFDVNYAVVSGVGVLSGKPYHHTEKIIRINESNGDALRMKAVKENHLVSFANSHNVARRVLDYYESSRTLKAKIMLQTERCGDKLSMRDAFDDQVTAFLQKMTVLPTSVIGAQCELIQGFTPGHFGNNYNNRDFLSADGVWPVPAGVTQLRIVLIGGGNGAQGGYDGGDGLHGVGHDNPWPIDYLFEYDEEYYLSWYKSGANTQDVSVGGAAGNPGDGGKILVADVTVVPGEYITFSFGAGGIGGSRNGGSGSVGGASTASSTSIGSITSDDGASNADGFYDSVTGERYGYAGESGHAGASGGRVDKTSFLGYNGDAGYAGDSAYGQAGGVGGSGMIMTIYYHLSKASGGGGGGAAYGADGNPGESASYQSSPLALMAGAGGNGADAAAPDNPTYGCGGGGGNGGGGGGNNGCCRGWAFDDRGVKNPSGYGHGGQGSRGGHGGSGCAIIYY